MMTDAELDAWLGMLGKSKRQRIAAVTDLLDHAAGDGMTDEDRGLCLRALRRLGAPYVRHRVPTNGNVTPRRYFSSSIDDDANAPDSNR